jgi:type IV pilus assembly protein PilO
MAIFVVVAGVIYGGFWYFVTSGTRVETKALMAQVEDLKQQNATAQIAQQRLNEFRATFRAKQLEYDDLKALLPEQRELTSVLQGVQDRARTTHLSLRRFTPKEDIQQDFFSGKPIEVEVTSSFANLRSFYEQMARYQRIVSISDFKISRLNDQDLNPGKTINAQFTMTAYYVSPENLQKTAPKPVAPAPGAAAAPAGAAPVPAK